MLEAEHASWHFLITGLLFTSNISRKHITLDLKDYRSIPFWSRIIIIISIYQVTCCICSLQYLDLSAHCSSIIMCVLVYNIYLMYLSMHCPRSHPTGKGDSEIKCLFSWSKFYDQNLMSPSGLYNYYWILIKSPWFGACLLLVKINAGSYQWNAPLPPPRYGWEFAKIYGVKTHP